MKKKWILCVLLLSLLCGCASDWGAADMAAETQADTAPQSAYTAPTVYSYDSVDTAIVVKKDMTEKTISLRNLETGRQYTLSYGGTSVLTDHNDQAMSMEQVALGDLVEVTFLKNRKTLTTLKESASAFVMQDVTDFTISESGRSMTIAGITYRICDDLAVVSENQMVSLMDINASDTLTVKGYENDVHSIVIAKGHGYLRLENAEAFLGGFIEVGNTMIVPITENMLLTVPEGSYQVSVSYGGSYGTKEVSIYRNQEQIMDVGDLAGEMEIREGGILFDITPATAEVYVDAEKVDTSEVLTLTYGVHQLIMRADGYTTLTKYLRVGQELATLAIEMEKNTGDTTDNDSSDTDDETTDAEADSDDSAGDEDDADTDSDNTSAENSNTDTSSEAEETTNTGDTSAVTAPADADTVTASDGTSYYVHIDAPEGAEVYVDGTYIGIAPVQFKKQAGSHIVSLRRMGYQTRSYTIEVDEEKKDVSYSFSALAELTGN